MDVIISNVSLKGPVMLGAGEEDHVPLLRDHPTQRDHVTLDISTFDKFQANAPFDHDMAFLLSRSRKYLLRRQHQGIGIIGLQ